jgi:hypothetical protein
MPPRKRGQSQTNHLPGGRRKKLASRRRRNLRLENPGRSCRERLPQCDRYRRNLRKFCFVWKAKCPPLADRTISGWLRTKTSLSLPRPISRTRSTHICFYQRHHLAQAVLGAGLTPIDTISRVVGITPTHRRSFCDALLRAWKILRMAARSMRVRLIGDHIRPPDELRTYRQDWLPSD